MADIRPIRTSADHAAALLEIEALWGSPIDSPEGDRLDVLATLVDAYERENVQFSPPDPVEAIMFRMDQLGLARKDLEPMLGSRARVSEILNRQRPLTLAMIRKLNAGLGIPVDILIQPSHKQQAS
jgi:HTH-type transcriptional regulator/antitoxin HigA